MKARYWPVNDGETNGRGVFVDNYDDRSDWAISNSRQMFIIMNVNQIYNKNKFPYEFDAVYNLN